MSTLEQQAAERDAIRFANQGRINKAQQILFLAVIAAFFLPMILAIWLKKSAAVTISILNVLLCGIVVYVLSVTIPQQNAVVTCWLAIPWVILLLWSYVGKLKDVSPEELEAEAQAYGYAQEEEPDASAPQDEEMSPAQAYRVLGLESGASEQDIQATYHRLMKHVHPDKGGSEFFTMQLNVGRDTLLNP